MKNQYDRHHISLLLNFRDLIILKLYHEYCVSDVKNKKLFIQQVNHFSIKQQISSLAYELKLLANMKIHSMMSVINFELISPGEDLLDSAVKLMLEYEIHQNSNLNHIIYLHKLL